MKPSKPPMLPTWLLDHAIPGDRNEALAGDLFEQFGQGRTSLWYWRQVFSAILSGYAKEWRVFAWASAVTLLWASVINVSHYWNMPGPREFFGFGTSAHRLLSLFAAAGSILFRLFVLMLVSASTYFGLGSSTQLTGNWRGRGVWRRGWSYIWKPLVIGYVTATIATLVLLAMLPARRHPILVANVAALVPVFVAVAVMAFVAPPNSMRSGRLTLFRINPPDNW